MSRLFLVTGGSGFLGSALVKALLAKGHRVRVLDDHSRGRLRRLQDVLPSIELFSGDIRDAALVRRAARGIDCLCHLAFINGTQYFYSQPELVLDVGVRGMLNVLDACLAEGVRELILASSSEVYQSAAQIPTDESVPLIIPDPFNPRYSYAAGKQISEIMAINFGRKHLQRLLIFRPHNVYGPDMGFEHVIPEFAVRAAALHRSTPVGEPLRLKIQGSGSEQRSFVYIDDFTDGLLCMMERGEHMNIYHIGTMEEVSIAKLAALVGQCYGRQVAIEPGPLPAGGTLRRCPDIRKLAALGYQPRIPLAEGLARTVPWYDEHRHLAPSQAEKGD